MMGQVSSPWTNRSRAEKQRPAKILLKYHSEQWVSPEERLLCLSLFLFFFHSFGHAAIVRPALHLPLNSLALIAHPKARNSGNITAQRYFCWFLPPNSSGCNFSSLVSNAERLFSRNLKNANKFSLVKLQNTREKQIEGIVSETHNAVEKREEKERRKTLK